MSEIFSHSRFVADTSFLFSAFWSSDVNHNKCHPYFRELHDIGVKWVIPGLVFFELDATVSREANNLKIERPWRLYPLYINNTELYEISAAFLGKVYELDLANKFRNLRGADLLYACIAKVEKIPLIATDNGFKKYRSEIEVIDPTERN